MANGAAGGGDDAGAHMPPARHTGSVPSLRLCALTASALTTGTIRHHRPIPSCNHLTLAGEGMTTQCDVTPANDPMRLSESQWAACRLVREYCPNAVGPGASHPEAEVVTPTHAIFLGYDDSGDDMPLVKSVTREDYALASNSNPNPGRISHAVPSDDGLIFFVVGLPCSAEASRIGRFLVVVTQPGHKQGRHPTT